MKRISLTLVIAIFVVFLAAPANAHRFEGSETQLTTDPADQFDPSISGAYTVYTDRRGTDADIYLYDIDAAVETQITSGGGDQFFNDISGDLVVYTDYGSGNAEIFAYNIATGQIIQLTDDPNNQRNPAISGNLVVYEDDRNGNYDIYMVNVDTLTETRLTDDPNHQRNPAINGSIVVWEDYRSGNADVYMKDLGTGIVNAVTDDLNQDRDPDVDGDIIAFGSNRASLGDIYYYRISTAETIPVTSDANYMRNPAVSGDYIAYESYASGDADIWLYSVSLGVAEQTTIDPASQYLHDLSGNRLVYTDNRSDNLDIYLFEFIFDGPDIDVSPASYDFGDVNVGDASTTIVTISNVDDANLTVSDIALTAGSSDFSIISSPPLPAVVEPHDFFDVGLTFAPSALGYVEATLEILSDDQCDPLVQVPLGGVGVSQELPPEGQIAAILAFFDASVEAGTLTGNGPGNSANNRLRVLKNMLEAAGDLIEDGEFEMACRQLRTALRKTDGQPRPPDFVTGDAASVLASMIEVLRATLECE